MNITESIVREYFIPEEYEKPKIEINSYFLKWNVKSYGISQKEVSELKRFLKNAIPHFDIIYELLNSLETSRAKEKRFLYEEFAPHIHLSYSNKNDRMVRYELYMTSDGSTIVDRLERFEIANKDNNGISKTRGNIQRHYVNSELYLKWNLGELLFNTQRGVVVGIK